MSEDRGQLEDERGQTDVGEPDFQAHAVEPRTEDAEADEPDFEGHALEPTFEPALEPTLEP